MEADLQRDRDPTQVLVHSADARCLPVLDGAIDVVITSPPYPNRHDYTRVFAVELELGFGLGEAVLNLRRQAVHSHPEAMPERPLLGYAENLEMARPIRELWAQHPDPRVARMLSGYLNDMHDVLVELRRVLRPGGRAALVVGNVRYCGIEIPVDDWIAELGTRAGFRCLDVRALRFRGNSAQQMALFGRSPSRESAVLLERP
jgi:tRNA G10  N-methylase Trm11